MAMTMRAVLEELDAINGYEIDEIGRDELVHAVARAALLGARGNTGVILSQIVRGAAEELLAARRARGPGARGRRVRTRRRRRLRVRPRPRRGHHAVRGARDGSQGRAGPREHGEGPARAGRGEDEQDELLAEVLERALEAGKEAVERGPDQLPSSRRPAWWTRAPTG